MDKFKALKIISQMSDDVLEYVCNLSYSYEDLKLESEWMAIKYDNQTKKLDSVYSYLNNPKNSIDSKNYNDLMKIIKLPYERTK